MHLLEIVRDKALMQPSPMPVNGAVLRPDGEAL